jgi:hypothetical protein
MVAPVVDQVQIAMVRLHVSTRAAGALLSRIGAQIDADCDEADGWDIRIERSDLDNLIRLTGGVMHAADALHALLIEREPDPEAPGSMLYTPTAVLDRAAELREIAAGRVYPTQAELVKISRSTALQITWLASLSGIVVSPKTFPK